MSKSGPPAPKRAKTDVSVADPSTFRATIEARRSKAGSSVMDFKYNKSRVRLLSKTDSVRENARGVVYWMSRDQRVQDNWSMLLSQKLAIKSKIPLHVVFCLMPKFLDATWRHYDFMLKGLKQVEKECIELNISFHLVLGQAATEIPAFVKKHSMGAVVSDFSPLRGAKQTVEAIKAALPETIAHCQVDAHNVVPCWVTSDKLEYAARTIRNKINSKLEEYLTEFPPVVKHPFAALEKPERVDWVKAEGSIQVDKSVQPVAWAVPGAEAGLQMLESFCSKRIETFAERRNDPTINTLSNLSPWLHFGQISAARAVLAVKEIKRKSNAKSVESFIEELVVRRELSDNFCLHNEKYDSIEGANDWAIKSLDLHRKDKRAYLYSMDSWEKAKTHDSLWNAAQLELINQGKIHGYMRMYWAKKILEWSPSPESALATAIYLNDKYSLDGRDPNGYVGCMWSICGIHDQGWAERSVFGKIRFMNLEGCKRKFNVESYINQQRGNLFDKNTSPGKKQAKKAT